MRPKLFIECGHTVTTGFRTGVQRVVRSVCRESLLNADHPFERCVPVQIHTHGIELVDTAHFLQPVSHETQPSFNSQKPRTLWGRIQREATRFWKKVRRAAGADRSAIAHENLASREIHSKSPTQSVPAAGDLLLLPDAYWANAQVWPMVGKLRQQGVRTAVVIYDLIPHQYPEIYGDEGAEHFRTYVRDVVRHADIVLTISETVAKDFSAEIPAIEPTWNGRTPVIPFRLGAEFQSPTVGEVRKELKQMFATASGRSPYLMVGTIEARKNHGYALDAMELLWNAGHDARLCIVGQPGWRGDLFLERARNHPEFGKRLQLFHNVSDCELNFAYQNARGVLFTSLSEGFGLPIVESLWHGKPTFVTDIPIHREVGGDWVQYCQLESPKTLSDLLLRNLHATDQSAEPTRFQPMGWPQAVHDLLRTLSFAIARINRAAA